MIILTNPKGRIGGLRWKIREISRDRRFYGAHPDTCSRCDGYSSERKKAGWRVCGSNTERRFGVKSRRIIVDASERLTDPPSTVPYPSSPLSQKTNISGQESSGKNFAPSSHASILDRRKLLRFN